MNNDDDDDGGSAALSLLLGYFRGNVLICSEVGTAVFSTYGDFNLSVRNITILLNPIFNPTK